MPHVAELVRQMVRGMPLAAVAYGPDGARVAQNPPWGEFLGEAPPTFDALIEEFGRHAPAFGALQRVARGDAVQIPTTWVTPWVQHEPRGGGPLARCAVSVDGWRVGEYRIVTVRDETPLMRAWRAEAAADRCGRVLEASDLVTWEIDLATGRLALGGKAEQRLGIRADDVGDLDDALAYVHPEHRGCVREQVSNAARTGEITATRLRWVRPDTRRDVWLDAGLRADRDRSGRITGLRGVLLDVTDRHAADMEVLASRARWQALVEGAPDIILLTDEVGSVQYANHLPEGVRRDAVIGRPWSDHISAEHHERLNVALSGARTSGQVAETEVVGVGPNGSTAWYSVRVSRVDRGEPAAGVLMILRDVTDRRRAEAQLLAADRMASVGTLVAGVAHEINNPLAAVVANLEHAERSLDADGGDPERPDLADTLHEARQAAERLGRVVRELKVFSRGEAPKQAVLDLRDVLESSVRLAGNEIRHRAQLVWDLGAAPAVLGDPSRLGQVFLNLLLNAAQAIPAGRADANEIRVSTRVDGVGDVVIRVADTGEGMTPEVQARLFTPFFTTRPVGTGTGLGLSIAQRIVAEHGGTITFESEVGRGSTFEVRLRPAISPVPSLSAPVRSSEPVSRARVLVIDDEPWIGLAVQRLLRKEHDVEATTDPGDALERLRAGERYDVLLCDVMMPNRTGADVFAEVEQLDPALARRMVFITGGAFTPATQAFLERVPNLRIDKPFDGNTLRAALREVLAAVLREA